MSEDYKCDYKQVKLGYISLCDKRSLAGYEVREVIRKSAIASWRRGRTGFPAVFGFYLRREE